jgi:hypothetical protein
MPVIVFKPQFTSIVYNTQGGYCKSFNVNYLGVRTISKAACDGMFSVTARLVKIRCRSLKALSGSPLRLALASFGLRAKRRGTGPLACSPSNMLQWEFHSAARTVGTASLDKRWTLGWFMRLCMTSYEYCD